MKKIRKGALCCILLLAIIISSIPMNKEIIKASSDSYLSVRGVDLSSIIAFEKSGQKFYYEDGKQGDIFDILKNSGVNYIRVRVWNNPYDTETGLGYGGGNNDIWKAIEIGKRATEKGMKVFVDFQYSDFWADPAKQYAPKEWKNYSNSKKISSIYQFTFSSLKTLIDSGINVGMVQIGNETNGSMCGMGGLYDGVWNLTSGVGDGLKSGCNAVNDINKYYGYSDSKKILRVLHFTDPTTTSEWYAEQVRNVGVDYDVLSVSAYPFWFGHASDLASTLKNISVKYNKKVMVAETAYPYTFNNADDTVNNIGSKEDMTYCDYPIICMDDNICINVLNSLRKYKVRIPKDIKIASFYNSQILDEYYPSISCVNLDIMKLAHTASDVLYGLLCGKSREKRIIQGYSILLKESTKV